MFNTVPDSFFFSMSSTPHTLLSLSHLEKLSNYKLVSIFLHYVDCLLVRSVSCVTRVSETPLLSGPCKLLVVSLIVTFLTHSSSVRSLDYPSGP